MKPSTFDLVTVDPKDPVLLVWFKEYAKHHGLGDVEPVGERWFGLMQGGKLRAVAGEQQLKNRNLKITNLLAEPSRLGLRAMQILLEMYAELAEHKTFPFIGADILATSHAIKRRARAAGFQPYSEVWYVGSLDAMK